MDTKSLLANLKDPKYFIERFFYIIDKSRKTVPFLFNQPQKEYYANRTKNDLILKSRKEGFSSLIEAIWLHACIFFENENCVTMAHTWDDTVIHMDRVKYFLETMGVSDKRFIVDRDKENQREIYFPQTNSRYWIGTAGSAGFGRGRDITKLHLSECAHYEDQTVLTSVMEACVPEAYKVLETTANGVGEHFHKEWQASGDIQLNSPWKRHFFPWHADTTNWAEIPEGTVLKLKPHELKMQKDFKLEPEQILWYRNKQSEMIEKEKMPQEYPSTPEEAFIMSGRPAFDLEKIREKKKAIKGTYPIFRGDLEDNGAEIRAVPNEDGFLRIWKMPRKHRQYLMAADVSEGIQGGDWSVIQVHDRASWEQVAVWRGRMNPGDFGRKMVEMGYFYNNAVLVPELNNHGWATIEAIESEEYPHLFKTSDIWRDGPDKNGFPTNERTRNLILTAARNAVTEDTVYFNDETTLNEYETFVQNEAGKFEAQKGCFDDCVISSAIAIFCLAHFTVEETYGEHVTSASVSPIGAARLRNNYTRKEGRRSATGYR